MSASKFDGIQEVCRAHSTPTEASEEGVKLVFKLNPHYIAGFIDGIQKIKLQQQMRQIGKKDTKNR